MSDTPTDEAPKRTVRIGLQILVVAAILFFLGRVLVQRWEEVAASLRSARVGLLVVAMGVSVAALILSGLGWHLVLRVLGERLRVPQSLGIFFWSQLAKYAPGHIWHFVGRVVLSRQLQVEARTSVVSLYLESVLIVGSAGIVAIPGLMRSDLPLYGRIGIAVALLPLTVSLLHPAIFAFVLRLFRRPGAEAPMYAWRRVCALIPLYALVWLTYGVAFTIFVRAFTAVGANAFLPLSAALAVAFVIGFVTPLAPAGIGVREGVLAFLLAQVVSVPMAALLALASRLWFIAAEVLSALLVSLLPGARAKRSEGVR